MNDVYRAVVTAFYSELPVQIESDIIPDKTIEFDFIDDRTVNSSATITSSPTVDGDYIADHMYREPKTISLNGKFALNGFRGTEFEGSESRLASIQSLFEDIQARGIRCQIATKNKNDTSSLFVVRDNMYLQSISWTEKVNSIDFSFNFTEVITIDVDEIKPNENVIDDTLPQLTNPKQTSAFGTIINMDDVNALIDKICLDTGLTSEEFWDSMRLVLSSIALVGAVTGGVAITAGVFTGATIGAVALASNPVGWIAAAGAGIAIAGLALWNVFSDIFSKYKYKEEQFKAYKDDKKMLAEVERYNNFKSQIAKQLLSIEDEIELYQFISDENQEMMLSIDGEIYDFEFIRNNNDNLYSCKVVNTTSQKIYNQYPISTLSDISNCTTNNKFFLTELSGYYVYIMCPILAGVDGQDACDELKKDLKNYCIMVLHFNPEEFTNILSEIIRNAILK